MTQTRRIRRKPGPIVQALEFDPTNYPTDLIYRFRKGSKFRVYSCPNPRYHLYIRAGQWLVMPEGDKMFVAEPGDIDDHYEELDENDEVIRKPELPANRVKRARVSRPGSTEPLPPVPQATAEVQAEAPPATTKKKVTRKKAAKPAAEETE